MAALLAAAVGGGGLSVPAGVGGKGAGKMTGDEVLKPAGSTTGTTFAGEGVGGGVGTGVGAGVVAGLGGGVSAGVGAAVLAGVGEEVVAATTGDVSESVKNKAGAVVGIKGVGWGGGGGGGSQVIAFHLASKKVLTCLFSSRTRHAHGTG